MTDDDDEPEPETIEDRMLRLEKVVEVLRQEVISQNKKLDRLIPLGGARTNYGGSSG